MRSHGKIIGKSVSLLVALVALTIVTASDTRSADRSPRGSRLLDWMRSSRSAFTGKPAAGQSLRYKDGVLSVDAAQLERIEAGAQAHTLPRSALMASSRRTTDGTRIWNVSAPGDPAPLDGLRLPSDLSQPVDIGPSLEELLRNPGQADLTIRCADEFATLKPITALTNRITAAPGVFPPECALESNGFTPRQFSVTRFTWKASGLCHKPLYFEQRALERYGHSYGPLIEPILSGAHFFACIPLLPYNIGMDPPWECQYDLGYYRPGSCAPYMIYPFPISARGLFFEGLTATGLVFLIP